MVNEIFVDIDLCPVCGYNFFKKLYHVNYFHDTMLEKIGIKEKCQVHLFECLKCKFNFISPQINEDVIKKYYSDVDSIYHDNFEIIKDDDSDTKILDFMKGDLKEKKVLEVGCGRGFLIYKLKERGCDCYGIDPSPSAINYAREKLNLNVKKGFLDLSTFSPAFFDVIIMKDILEHIKEPLSIIETAKYYLKNNGLLIISTGNIGSFNAKMSRELWGYFREWEHISFFKKESIEYLLKAAGFNEIIYKTISHRGGFSTNIYTMLNNFLLLIKNFIKLIINLIYHKKKYKSSSINLAFDHLLVGAISNKDTY